MIKRLVSFSMLLCFLVSSLCFVSCDNSNRVVKDGVIYKKVRQMKNGITVECFYTYGCNDNIEVLKIAEEIDGISVLGINREAFKNKTNLKEVVLPDSITSIPPYSSYFVGCTNIEKITLATDDVLNLFSKSGSSDDNNTEPLPKSLKKIYLTYACKEISPRKFRYCKYLEELHIPSSVSVIDDGTKHIHIGVNGNSPSNNKFEELPFLGCENLTVFCQASSQPKGWGEYWDNINETTKLTVKFNSY